MMHVEEVASLIDNTRPLFERAGVAPYEAEVRSGKFLIVRAHIYDALDQLYAEASKVTSLLILLEAKLSEDETVKSKKAADERKAALRAHPEYLAARERAEAVERKINYFKAHDRNLEQAHILFRQVGNEV